MRAVVFGVGRIGIEVARELSAHDDVKAVHLADVDAGALERARERLDNKDKLVAHTLAVTATSSDDAVREAMRGAIRGMDVAVFTLPNRRTSYHAFEAAIAEKVSGLDILEESHRHPDPEETEGVYVPRGMSLDEYGQELHERAAAANIVLVDGMGLAPGLTNVTLAKGIRSLDEVESAVARVGGIPVKSSAQERPLQYMITWTFEHVLREYMVHTKVRRGGDVVEVPAMTGRELFCFDAFGQQEMLECAITPGMPTFIHTRPQLRDFAEKTIRWPGHWDQIETLKSCGLLDLEPINAGYGITIEPRSIVSAILSPRLKPRAGDRDVAVMWNSVTGSRAGKRQRIDYYMWNEADPIGGVSAMAASTAYPAALVALMVGRRQIKGRGIVAPEDALNDELYETLISELAHRHGIVIEERVGDYQPLTV